MIVPSLIAFGDDDGATPHTLFPRRREERHFTRAAAKIGIGQPPLSQQIKDLEAEIGAPLFHRVAHGAELTSAGEAFLQAVKEMPTLAERATKAARRAARGETGSLRLGYTPSATFNAAVPSAIPAFPRAYPEGHPPPGG